MVPILVILTIAAFLIVELAIAWRRKKAREREAAAVAVPATALVPHPAYRMPEGLFYHGGHTWAHLAPSGEALVGMDDFAQAVIGRIDRVELPEPGAPVRQGETAFTVVQGTKRLELVSPLSGEVCAVNDRAGADLRSVKADPYGDGWLLRIRPDNIVHDLRKLRISRDAAAWLERESARFAEFLTLHMAVPQEVGVTMQDGGRCVDGIVEGIDGELLQRLVRKFFR